MTHATTRRGVRPLLALLFTGMTLLMMGEARSVLAATATAAVSVTSKGSVSAPDEISYTGMVMYTGPAQSVGMSYYVNCIITYYNGGTPVGTPTTISVVSTTGVSGGSPIGVSGTPSCGAGQYALSKFDTDTETGFEWHYVITVNGVDDQNTTVATATGISVSQYFGYTTGSPGGPNG